MYYNFMKKQLTKAILKRVLRPPNDEANKRCFTVLPSSAGNVKHHREWNF
jgi:hypothetical protein